MFSSLPSLPAIRTFEAAARLGSFKAAAEELSVSATAVSHQVRALEQSLDAALFVRRTRAVELTEAGVDLARAANAGLSAIQSAVEELRADAAVIRVTTIPAFATLRLATAVRDFERANPGLSVQIDMGTTPVDLRRDRRFDLAIRYGVGPYPGLVDVPLIQERFGAYCAPQRSDEFADLATAPLIETTWVETGLRPVGWTAWFAAAGRPPPSAPTVQFREEMFVIQAAIAGQGVALISNALVGDLLDRALLEPIQPDVSVSGIGYRAVCLPERIGSRKLDRFLRWLTDRFALGEPRSRLGET